jgi:hypothetical protein
MNSLVATLVLLAWGPIAVGLFAWLPPRRALLAAMVAGWLFLPVAVIDLPGLPDYGKVEATCVGALAGVVLFDSKRLSSYRFDIVDSTLWLWCLAPIPTSVSNGLGVYDGLSGALTHMAQWGVPTLLGRVYLRDRESLREAAIALMLGGIVYVPICWIEIVMSPQLHRWIYGYFPMDFYDLKRGDGFKPAGFLGSGVGVPTYMAAATTIAYAFWRDRTPLPASRVKLGATFALLAFTTVNCKSFNGMGELLAGVGLVEASRRGMARWLLVGMAVAPLTYMALRATSALPAERLTALVEPLDADRAESLGERLTQEDLFTDHTWRRPVFGWSGWMRNFPTNEYGERLTRGVDGFWVVAISKFGLFGLTMATVTMVLSLVLLAMRVPPRAWNQPELGIVFAVAIVVSASVVDNLFNGQLNPLFMLLSGGMTTFAITWPASSSASVASTTGECRRAAIATPRRRLVTGGPVGLG